MIFNHRVLAENLPSSSLRYWEQQAVGLLKSWLSGKLVKAETASRIHLKSPGGSGTRVGSSAEVV